MRGLTLTQPWATLMALGDKKLETRSWATSYRGPVAIHAAKGFPKWAQAICLGEPFKTLLALHGYLVTQPLPLGAIVAVETLSDICSTEEVVRGISEQERALGDYTPGRYAWVFEGMRAVLEPIPWKGMLGLWEVPDDLEARLALE